MVVGSSSSDDRIQRPRPQFTSPIRFDLGSDKKILGDLSDNHDNKIHTSGQEWINARNPRIARATSDLRGQKGRINPPFPILKVVLR